MFTHFLFNRISCFFFELYNNRLLFGFSPILLFYFCMIGSNIMNFMYSLQLIFDILSNSLLDMPINILKNWSHIWLYKFLIVMYKSLSEFFFSLVGFILIQVFGYRSLNLLMLNFQLPVVLLS